MFNSSQKVKGKNPIKNPAKLIQVSQWKKSEFCNVSSSFHNKDKATFDPTTEFLDNCLNFYKEEIEEMLKSGININCCDKDNLTALHQACINANLELVKYLLLKGANINAIDKEGWTPLHIAASIGSLELARYLLEHGAKLETANYDGDLPISIIDDKEHRDLILYFKKEMNKRNIDENECRNFERIIMTEDVSLWKLSGQYNPPIDSLNYSTPLHVASSKNYLDILFELIPLLNSHQLNAQDSDGWTSLHAAAHWGNLEACMALIKAGADVDIVTRANETVLDTVDPLIKDQLIEEINAIKLENMKSNDVHDQLNIRNETLTKRRSSIVRQSVEWKKNTQSKDPLMERQIYSEAAQSNDISAVTPKEEDIDKTLKGHKAPHINEYPSIIETVEPSMDRLSQLIVEDDGMRSKSTISVTSPSVDDMKEEHIFIRPSATLTHKSSADTNVVHITEGDTSPIVISPQEEFKKYSSFEHNNGASCEISENSSCSSESERINTNQVKMRPKSVREAIQEHRSVTSRLSLVMAPSKCDESEAHRREKARHLRSNRRSTQGISSDTVAAIKRRELEIINDGVFRKHSDIREEEDVLIKEINVPIDLERETKESIKDNDSTKYTDLKKYNEPIKSIKTSYDSLDKSPPKPNYNTGYKHVESPRPVKLQHQNSLNIPTQKNVEFSKVLPKRDISNLIGSLMKQKPSTSNSPSVNIHRTSSMNTNIEPKNQRDVYKISEKGFIDKDVVEELRECDSGSFVAKAVPGTGRTKAVDVPDNLVPSSLPALSQTKPQSIQSTYISKCASIAVNLSQEEIQKYNTIASHLANEQNIKIELQVEIAKLKSEIQDLKDSREGVDAALKISRNTNGDRIYNLESELIKTKEENKKLKLQNEALLRVISKIQQDLEVYKNSESY